MPVVVPEDAGGAAEEEGGTEDVGGTEVAGAELLGTELLGTELLGTDAVDCVEVWEEEDAGREELPLLPLPELPELNSKRISPSKSKKSTPIPTINKMVRLSLR